MGQRKVSGIPSVHLKKIGEQFKISESAVSHAVSRVSKTIAKDKKGAKKN